MHFTPENSKKRKLTKKFINQMKMRLHKAMKRSPNYQEQI